MAKNFAVLVTLACLLRGSFAQESTVSTTPVATATATPEDPDATLPSQVALPPRQEWCPSEIFCPGSLLQTVNLAKLFPDDKTFADKPTSKAALAVLGDFENLGDPSAVTQREVADFVSSDFGGEGQELQPLQLDSFVDEPAFLNNVTDSLARAFTQTVHGFWNQLIRGTNESALCSGADDTCESSLIPLNHTFVVPGGRFREQYYWDSFWIVEGLLESQLYDIAADTLQNFMDELDTIGFIPNGGRIYYLDRSQPPLFIQMLWRYVTVTGNRDILTRALPLAEKELTWWASNRLVNVTSPFTNKTHGVYHYAVNNSAPRPESYRTDYLTANDPPTLDESQRADLYAELASGAETGWDYTVRWYSDAMNNDGLRSLNVRGTIGIDLNSILYRDHVILAGLYGNDNTAARDMHQSAADALREAIIDLCWDAEKLAFYDFNIRTNQRNTIFTVATFYPLWSGIIPDEVLASSENAFGAFSTLNLVLNRYNGTYPTTFIDSGLQWDAPNSWPPHNYIVLQALRALPSNVTGGPLPTPGDGESSYSLIPDGQIGLAEDQLPGQPLHGSGSSAQNATTTGTAADINTLDGTVINGGNATEGEGWGQILQRELANRYFASALCSWHATGGSIPGVLSQLSEDQLNVTQSVGQTGNMFEKFSNLDIDSAGRGGEYTVQAGFGWTNGVLLWVASNYGSMINQPLCPNLLDFVDSDSDSVDGGAASSVSAPIALLMSTVATVVAYALF